MCNTNAGLLAVCILFILRTAVTNTAMVCYFGKAPDPESNGSYRWMIPIEDPCQCTEIMLGGMNMPSIARLPFRVKYYDTILQSSNSDEIRTWLNCSNTSSPKPVFLDCPADDIIVANPFVTYTIPTAVDANTNVSLTVSCNPTSATNFTKIRTVVTCRTSDATENVGTKDCTFNVTLACRDPLGMESGAIPDSSLSCLPEMSVYSAVRSPRLNKDGGWCMRAYNDSNQRIRVDLGAVTTVTGLITQGNAFKVWVTSFNVQYSDNGTNWSDAVNANGSTVEFQGNVDGDTPVTNYFPTVLNTRFIQIRPLTSSWTTFVCLRFELLGCRACSFTLKPADPAVVKFLVQPLGAPFRLDFNVKTYRDAIIVLAENKTEASVFAWITIGGWQRQRSAIRACFGLNLECEQLLDGRSEHREEDIVSDTESRPFWMEYKRGVVTVGKGGQEAAFMEWDAAAYYRRNISAPVYVGISSWKHVPAQWVFPQFCA